MSSTPHRSNVKETNQEMIRETRVFRNSTSTLIQQNHVRSRVMAHQRRNLNTPRLCGIDHLVKECEHGLNGGYVNDYGIVSFAYMSRVFPADNTSATCFEDTATH